MKTYPTEAYAFRRQSFLVRTFGIFSGVRKCGDRWELLFNPETLQTRNDIQLPDKEAEYVEDEEEFAWLS